MAELCSYATRPLAFVFRYIRLRPLSHAVILGAVLAAVACSVGTQYGVKYLVDTLSSDAERRACGSRFCLLGSLIAADNLLWRVASWIANFAFVGVTGDLRRDLFRHLTGHSPAYFADRLPGMLTSRVTATSNAVFTAENMFVWNVLPPCAATVAAIALVFTISVPMACALAVVAGVMVCLMFRLAAAGRPLHHDFAGKAAAVDGEMVDVVTNMPLVRAFGGFLREHRRFDATVDREMDARRRSLLYLEKLRIFHAAVTVILALGLARLGDHALGARRGDDRRCRARLHARDFRPASRRAILRWRWSTSPSIIARLAEAVATLARAARTARSPRSRSRSSDAAPASSSSISILPIPTANGFSRISS